MTRGVSLSISAAGSETDELGASVSADGVLWFASDRAGGAGAWDLYTAEPSGEAFAPPERAGPFNTTTLWEFNPAISSDGQLLVFTSIGRDGGAGLGDLYYASRDGEWSAEQPMPVNTAADEYHASFSPDGERLFFVRRTGDGDFHEVPWRAP